MPDVGDRVRTDTSLSWEEHPETSPLPGQTWGFWAFDDQLYVRMTVERVTEVAAHGRDEDGNPCSLGLRRFAEADLLESATPPKPPVGADASQEFESAAHEYIKAILHGWPSDRQRERYQQARWVLREAAVSWVK